MRLKQENRERESCGKSGNAFLYLAESRGGR
jgi:hypothetical protein